MKQHFFTLFILCIFCASTSFAQKSFFTEDELTPLTIKWLPTPPEENSLLQKYDDERYAWGKIMRQTPRGEEAKQDAPWEPDNICKIFQGAFGMELSEKACPKMYNLLHMVMYDVAYASYGAKHLYNRKRPYVLHNESTMFPEKDDLLRKQGSYPSGHALGGVTISQILANINPERMDTLLARGYAFGESRVITGFHWQSDVDAGRLAGSALFAKLMTNKRFLQRLKEVKKEYAKRKN